VCSEEPEEPEDEGVSKPEKAASRGVLEKGSKDIVASCAEGCGGIAERGHDRRQGEELDV
jgi:hypothetical protein